MCTNFCVEVIMSRKITAIMLPSRPIPPLLFTALREEFSLVHSQLFNVAHRNVREGLVS